MGKAAALGAVLIAFVLLAGCITPKPIVPENATNQTDTTKPPQTLNGNDSQAAKPVSQPPQIPDDGSGAGAWSWGSSAEKNGSGGDANQSNGSDSSSPPSLPDEEGSASAQDDGDLPPAPPSLPS